MSRSKWMGLSVAGWVVVWAFWLIVTRDFHPLFSLALVVTTSLVVAYAIAAYVNHLILIPRFLIVGRLGPYVVCLIATMTMLTAVSLGVIRLAYFQWHGPDADPYGVYKHYFIDLLGMAVHLLVVAGVVAIYRRLFSHALREQKSPTRDAMG